MRTSARVAASLLSTIAATLATTAMAASSGQDHGLVTSMAAPAAIEPGPRIKRHHKLRTTGELQRRRIVARAAVPLIVGIRY